MGNKAIIRTQFLGLLNADTLEGLQMLADRKRERELVERARQRKVPLTWQQRQAAVNSRGAK
jgi:hypothetical protein